MNLLRERHQAAIDYAKDVDDESEYALEPVYAALSDELKLIELVEWVKKERVIWNDNFIKSEMFVDMLFNKISEIDKSIEA